MPYRLRCRRAYFPPPFPVSSEIGTVFNPHKRLSLQLGPTLETDKPARLIIRLLFGFASDAQLLNSKEIPETTLETDGKLEFIVL